MDRKIFINGYFGYYNFGDDLLLEEFTKNHLQKEKIHVLVKEPYYQLKVNYINRYHVLKLFFLIHKKDVLINLGGLLQDRTSGLSFYYYFFINIIFLLRQKDIFFVNTDFLDVTSRFNKRLVLFLLRRSTLVILRNKKEYSYYRRFIKPIYYSPDILYFSKIHYQKTKKKYILAGLRDDKHLNLLLLKLKNQKENIKILIMNKEKKLLKKILFYFNLEDIYIYQYSNLNQILKLIGNAEKIITMRYHIGVLGLLLHKDVSIIDISNKMRSLIQDYRNVKENKPDINTQSYK